MAIARIGRPYQPDYSPPSSDNIDMPNQTQPSPLIQRGDTFACNRSYLDRQTLHRDKLGSTRGQVTALHRFAQGVLLADVDWEAPGFSKQVYVKDLVKVYPPLYPISLSPFSRPFWASRHPCRPGDYGLRFDPVRVRPAFAPSIPLTQKTQAAPAALTQTQAPGGRPAAAWLHYPLPLTRPPPLAGGGLPVVRCNAIRDRASRHQLPTRPLFTCLKWPKMPQ